MLRCTVRSSDRLRSKTLLIASLLLRTSGRNKAGAGGARFCYVLARYLARSICPARSSGSARRRPSVLRKQRDPAGRQFGEGRPRSTLARRFPKKGRFAARLLRSTFQTASAALAKRRGQAQTWRNRRLRCAQQSSGGNFANLVVFTCFVS